ncbi:MAG: extracellular solute-binding protein [Anaerolineales bacterium]
MFSKKFVFVSMLVLALMMSACGGSPAVSEENVLVTEPIPNQSQEAEISGDLVIYSGRSEPLFQPVVDAFRAKYPNVNVLLKAGSNSELANALIEEQTNPQADLFVTTELFTIQSLAAQGIFQAYIPIGVENIPAEFVSPDNLWTGLTLRARVIIYNKDLVSEDEAPTSIFDLTDSKWKGQVAAAGSTNGGMQAQIAAMQQLLGDDAAAEWLNGLIANDVTFFGGHTDVRKAVGAGEFKLGLVNHYYYHLQLAEGSNVGVIYPDQADGDIGLIVNATSAAIVNGAKHSQAAQAFLDFLVSEEGQKIFAEQNYEYPLLAGVPLKDGVQPLENFRLAEVNIVQAASNFEAAFDLIEQVGLP